MSLHCVIGSGPSGVACAQALLDQGATVLMVDAGVILEADRADRVAAMNAKASTAWSAEDLSFVREGTSASKAGIPLKRLYGSDFPYQEAEGRLGLKLRGVGIQASLARGGLSNVWGAAMLPYLEADMVDWPFGAARLMQHYRAISALTGMSAVRDDLASEFPLFTDEPTRLEPSQQASQMLARLEQHRTTLTRAGWRFGRSRLAVRGEGHRPGCVYCSLCMYGCPYGLIYNSSSTLDELRAHPRFTYRAGVVVDSVREDDAVVTLSGSDRATGAPVTISADRMYLAAGVISSTRIMLRSLSAYDHPLTMLDSQYFLVPLLASAVTRDVRAERLHTLSQLFLELNDPSVSPFGVHLQVYTYSDLIGQAVRSAFGPMSRLFDRVASGLESRMLVLQGYLHSSHSGTIRTELRRTTAGDALHLDGVTRDETRRVIGRVLRKLVRHSRHLGALPVLPLAKIAEPGRGFHAGGTFPMRERPNAMETDVLGRPTGWLRLHLVDSSVLPSIPATTITFAVMANAHRIGTESVSL